MTEMYGVEINEDVVGREVTITKSGTSYLTAGGTYKVLDYDHDGESITLQDNYGGESAYEIDIEDIDDRIFAFDWVPLTPTTPVVIKKSSTKTRKNRAAAVRDSIDALQASCKALQELLETTRSFGMAVEGIPEKALQELTELCTDNVQISFQSPREEY